MIVEGLVETPSGLTVPSHLGTTKEIKAEIKLGDLSEEEAASAKVEAENKPSKARMASQLPVPTGYKLLLGLPEVDPTYKSGIVKAHETMDIEEVSTVTGYVISMGPDAYSDEKRFPSGAYCEIGDWVVFRAFTGTRIKVHGVEFRLINDDSVEAVVEDPQGIARA